MHLLAGGEQETCICNLLISLEETSRGGFIARSEFPDPHPGVLNPIPQIMGWLQEETYQMSKLFDGI